MVKKQEKHNSKAQNSQPRPLIEIDDPLVLCDNSIPAESPATPYTQHNMPSENFKTRRNDHYVSAPPTHEITSEQIRNIITTIIQTLAQAGYSRVPYDPWAIAFTKGPTPPREEPILIHACKWGVPAEIVQTGIRIVFRTTSPHYRQTREIINTVIPWFANLQPDQIDYNQPEMGTIMFTFAVNRT